MTYLFVCTEMKLFLLQLVIKGLDADPYCFQAALNEPYAAVAFIASHDALPQRHSLPLPPASSRLGWQGAPPRPSCWSANGKAFVLFVGERERDQLPCAATCIAPAARMTTDAASLALLDQGIGIPEFQREVVGRWQILSHRRQHPRGSRDVGRMRTVHT